MQTKNKVIVFFSLSWYTFCLQYLCFLPIVGIFRAFGKEKLNILAEVCSKRLAEEYPDENRVEYIGHGGEATYSKPNAVDKLKDLIREKGGSDEKLIIEKTLYGTDVNKGQNRLSMPLKQILSDDFLDDDEKKKILNDGVVVGFIEPSLEETTMSLKKWNYKTTSSYVLVTNWHQVVTRNGLKKGDTVQVWFFRVHGLPWIALVKVS